MTPSEYQTHPVRELLSEVEALAQLIAEATGARHLRWYAGDGWAAHITVGDGEIRAFRDLHDDGRTLGDIRPGLLRRTERELSVRLSRLNLERRTCS